MRALLVLAVLVLSPAYAAPPPVVDFVEKPMVDAVSLSPTGAYVAMTIPRDDHSEFVVLDRATMKPSASLKLKRDEYIDEFWWVNDKRLVISLARRLGDFDSPGPTGELYGIDADGKKSKYLFGYRGKNSTGTGIKTGLRKNASAYVLESRADADDRILVGISHWDTTGETPMMELARMHVGTGGMARVGTAPVRYVGWVLTDHEQHLRLIGGVEADRLQKLFYRKSVDADWTLVNDQKQSGRIIEPLAYARDGMSIYARVEDGKGPAALVRWNPETGEEKQIYRDAAVSVGGVVLTADEQDVYAVHVLEGRGGYAFLDPKSPEAQLTTAVMESYPGEMIIANSFSRDGRVAIVMMSSDLTPVRYYLFERDSKKLTQLISARPKLKADQLASVEPFEFKARDGVTIHGLLTTPQGDAKHRPMLVLVHGGPYGIMDQWGFHKEAQLFASRGYAVLQVNFRGSGGYGKAFEDAGAREWGGKMQFDVTDATRWAIEQGVADPKRICIYGASYGGYAALMGLIQEPELYQCAIGYAGVYDLRMMTKRGDSDDTALGRTFLNDVLSDDPDWLRERSPALRAADIKHPVLIIHGGQDERVPPGHAYALRDAMKAADKPLEWYFEPAETHGFYQTEHNVTAYEKMLAFLQQNIGEAAP
jgi:dipeptidyl aminopeptidase/acylaminoacyl peptidase